LAGKRSRAATWVLISVCAATFVMVLDLTAVAIAVGNLRMDLPAKPAEMPRLIAAGIRACTAAAGAAATGERGTVPAAVTGP
jgi:hypothetical protein